MVRAKNLPDIEVLHEWFRYDNNDGILYWKKSRSNVRQGSKTGSPVNGYLRVSFNGRGYYVHRIIWAMHHGKDPGQLQIDHKNGIKHDNRIDNLRTATSAQNNWNKKERVNSTSGIKGISWDKSRKKWRVFIEVNGKQYNKRYSDKNHAIAARVLAEYRLQGEFGFSQRK